MKKFALITLICALALSLCFLVSCDDEKKINDYLSSAGSIVIVDKNTSGTVIHPSVAEPGSAQTIAAGELRGFIADITGSSPRIATDYIKAGQDHNHDTVEILIGNTSYSETAEVVSGMNYGEFVVKAVGNKLVIAGYSDRSLAAAVKAAKNLFVECAEKGSLAIPADTYITGVTDESLCSLPIFDGGVLTGLVPASGESVVLTFGETIEEQYGKYLDKLESNGYVKYTDNKIKDNLFATYNSPDYTINVMRFGFNGETRVIFEPFAPQVGLESDNVYTEVTTSQITLLGLEYTSGGSQVNNGLSMLIRLADGSFIIIDGGFNRQADADKLVDLMKTQSSGYRKAGEKITIAAWIVTHAHGDHMGMIGKKYSTFKNDFKVERFIVNFLDEEERVKAVSSVAYGGNYSTTEGAGWVQVIEAASALGATVFNVHPGQVFYFADMTAEVLYTIDGRYPALCNALNTTSLVIKMTFKTGDVFMMTGDATGNAFELCANMYGDYLACDMLQVAHHGYTTWGNNAGTIKAYNLMAPKTLIWPVGTAGYSSNMKLEYNVVLYSPATPGGKNNNFKESYFAGLESTNTYFPIPYKVGNAVKK